MLGSIGAVLAGAIWGDHCSPISDTTVLSSASAQCGHLDHVATQFPYALTVGLIALLLGYVPRRVRRPVVGPGPAGNRRERRRRAVRRHARPGDEGVRGEA